MKKGQINKVEKVVVSEEIAERFFSDMDFTFKAKCPYCKQVVEIKHGGSGSAFYVPDELMEEVGYLLKGPGAAPTTAST
jgi:hypothetical protein